LQRGLPRNPIQSSDAVVRTYMKPIAALVSDECFARGLACGFGRGTRLMTSDGQVPVDEIEPGEAVLDFEGRPHFVLWQGGWDVQPMAGWAGDPRHPVVISANAFGPGKPRRDLYLSQQNRVMVEADKPDALLRAVALAPHLARIDLSGRAVSYHVVVTRSPCLLMAENLPCQSHQPGARGLWDIGADSECFTHHLPQEMEQGVALRP